MAFLSAPLPLSSSPRFPVSTRSLPSQNVCMATESSPSPSSNKRFTRRVFLSAVASASASLAAASISTAEQAPNSSLQYKVIKHGTGPAPQLGDLVGIRFKGMYNGVVFDNLFNSSQPYFYRTGSATILKGLEEAVMLMCVGDVFELTLPGDLAFGPKGRRASAGKPSIPGNATLVYTIELSTIPGREAELLETNASEPDM